jgi:hypothetical protein
LKIDFGLLSPATFEPRGAAVLALGHLRERKNGGCPIFSWPRLLQRQFSTGQEDWRINLFSSWWIAAIVFFSSVKSWKIFVLLLVLAKKFKSQFEVHSDVRMNVWDYVAMFFNLLWLINTGRPVKYVRWSLVH